MRTVIIALGLAALYMLCAPADQPLWSSLAAGVLCLLVALAIVGAGSKTVTLVANLIGLLTPYLALIVGVAALTWGIHLYLQGPQILSINDVQLISMTDEVMPMVSCLAGGLMIIASCMHFYLQIRGKR